MGEKSTSRVDVVIGASFLIAWGALAFLVVWSLLGRGDDPEFCYAITDRHGQTYESVTPPIPSEFGFVWKRDDAWGYVQAPDSVTVDRDCLRDKGVDVPPLED